MSVSPRVSVLMPVWNVAPFVEEAVASTLAQTFGDFELFVLDDGSTDGTADIVSGMGDSRLKVFRSPVHMGMFGILNIGLELARGEYIARMDGDDLIAPDRFALQVALLETSPEVTVCGTDLEMFGTLTGRSDAPQHDGDIKALFLEAARNIFDGTSMFRRDFVMDNRIRWNPAHVAGGDLAFWVDCMRAGAVFANVKKPLYRYRRHETNISHKIDDTRASLYRIRRHLVADYFPNLTQAEADALANLLTGRPLGASSFSFSGLCEAVAAAIKAKGRVQSRYGESRDVLNQILDNRILQFQRALLGQG